MPTFLQPDCVYGPFHSRRLGSSLGLNLMPVTGKICTFDCIYCENGFNADRRTKDGYVPLETFTAKLEAVLARLAEQQTPPDVLTFAGNGEPTACPWFPEAVDAALELRDRLAPSARVCVLSDGTQAARPAVRRALLALDDPIMKLDTVDDDFIRLVNRPLNPRYRAEAQVEAYRALGGHCTVQTIFLRGEFGGQSVDNTSERYVAPWLDALRRIAPHAATIYTIARDTPARLLEKAPAETLDAIAERVRALGIPCSVAY